MILKPPTRLFKLTISKELIIEGLEQHYSQLMREKIVSALIYSIPGLPPSQITLLPVTGKPTYPDEN